MTRADDSFFKVNILRVSKTGKDLFWWVDDFEIGLRIHFLKS